MAYGKMRSRTNNSDKDREHKDYNTLKSLLGLRDRSFQSRDPYTENYGQYEPDHKKFVTGYEYPSLSDPKEKRIWRQVINDANCYAYAFGKSKGVHFPQPGHFGIPNMQHFHNHDREFTCSNYLSRLLLDNPSIYPVSHKKKCKDGYYKVYFTIAPNRDYHLYRQDRDGMYSHKPGSTEATTRDSSMQKISDPQHADRYNPPDDSGYHSSSALYYNTLCNSFCVPNKSHNLVHID